MGIKYVQADDIRQIAEDIVQTMNWQHIRMEDVGFLRSFGSTTRRTIARCHALGKAMQLAMKREGFYLVEVISEKFDRLSDVDKVKTVIHELMHIPSTFGGGFRQHHIVNEQTVRNMHERYCNLKQGQLRF